MLDYDRARATMVDGQLRPNKVTDPVLLAVLRTLPRELFVPPALAGLAYLDEDLPLGEGRVLMEPLVTARLAQLARPRQGERTLVVGGGTGYLAAILSLCGANVVLLDDSEPLLAVAARACAAVAPKVRVMQGPLGQGFPSGAPFDLVVVQGAVPVLPPSLTAQLGPLGRLVAVLAGPGGICQAVVAEPVGGVLRPRPAFDCATPVLSSLVPAPAFRF